MGSKDRGRSRERARSTRAFAKTIACGQRVTEAERFRKTLTICKAPKLCAATPGPVKAVERSGISVRPRFPALAQWLHISIDIDVFYPIDTIFYGVGRILIFAFHRLEEW